MQNTSDRRAKQQTRRVPSQGFAHTKSHLTFSQLSLRSQMLPKPSTSAAVTGFIWPPSKPDLWGTLPACTKSRIRLPAGPCKPFSPFCGAGSLSVGRSLCPASHSWEMVKWYPEMGKWNYGVIREFSKRNLHRITFSESRRNKILYCRIAKQIYKYDIVTMKPGSWAHFLSSLTGSAEGICSQLVYLGKYSSKIQSFLLYTCISDKEFFKLM